MLKYRVPSKIITDARGEFDSRVANLLNSQLAIKRVRTSRYAPRSNADIDVRWRSWKKFPKRNSVDMDDMKKLLPRFLFAINNAIILANIFKFKKKKLVQNGFKFVKIFLNLNVFE